MAEQSTQQTAGQVNADQGWNTLMRTLARDAPRAVANTRRGIRVLARLPRAR